MVAAYMAGCMEGISNEEVLFAPNNKLGFSTGTDLSIHMMCPLHEDVMRAVSFKRWTWAIG
ncbi:hypothetical protein PDUR_25540 [Paenibacillus durus]|uniref:Uncharacterized protein n=1 Tax=Paenibacillus durus TaxID=44251 RepID=A0A089HS76_PAEDU|nr:hypothetical protein PDUR_25540 [Paenibacillus durus]